MKACHTSGSWPSPLGLVQLQIDCFSAWFGGSGGLVQLAAPLTGSCSTLISCHSLPGTPFWCSACFLCKLLSDSSPTPLQRTIGQYLGLRTSGPDLSTYVGLLLTCMRPDHTACAAGMYLLLRALEAIWASEGGVPCAGHHPVSWVCCWWLSLHECVHACLY